MVRKGPQFERNGLALARAAANLASPNRLGEIVRRSHDYLRVRYFHPADAPAQHAFLEASQNGFHFGEFRHLVSGPLSLIRCPSSSVNGPRTTHQGHGPRTSGEGQGTTPLH